MFAPLLAIAALALQTSSAPADTTGKEDRLLHLISAQSAQLIEKDGINYRKVVGPAQFLHNNTYIICDTAIWSVEKNVIDAVGNVQIIQEQTALYSDKIHYIADSSLAQVRGNLVQLVDKEKNRLRTLYLDYHTKDSVARFFSGGSMIDEKGNTIESSEGVYESKLKRFRFLNNVEMKVDSAIIKTDSLAYLTQAKRTVFLGKTHAWQDSLYLRANKGWYQKDSEQYLFNDSVFVLTNKQEVWADTLFYDKKKGEAELFSNIQIVDTTQKALFFGDYGKYTKDPFNVILAKKPSAGYYTADSTARDTLFITADTLRYYTKKMFELDSSFVSLSNTRLKQSKVDPLEALIKNVTQKNLLATKGAAQSGKTPVTGKPPVRKPQTDTAAAPADTLKPVTIPDDPIKTGAGDSTAVIKDTTSVRFALAFNNVRIFRSDMQAIADSLVFNSIDSIARMYRDPVMWNEGSQFTADSIQFVMSKNRLVKAELISSAYYISKQDSLYFNQIKSADMIGFFSGNKLNRFDALGGVSLLFFLAEDSIITSMNQKECKFLSATIDSGKLQRVKYYDNIKSDMLPVVKLERGKDKLKGFNWRDSARPSTRFDVCSRIIKSSERDTVQFIKQPLFPNTNRFFGEKKTGKTDKTKPAPAATPSATKQVSPTATPANTIKKQTGKTDLPSKSLPVNPKSGKPVKGELQRAPLPDIKR
jgi:lipopolysaccharide export system protein LptA